ncbi:MAG: ribonuclease III [Burkholderiales bacterium]|nr:ribonuclease III [Burkholderiales bacterium]
MDAKKLLGYVFVSPTLLRQALTHRSALPSHNERLEFVGDSVLNCIVAQVLYARFPDMPEGDLSRVRAALVNRETLARLAKEINLARYLKLGEGELKSGGSQRASILADALEAVFGAVFIDGGFDAARDAVFAVYGETLRDIDPERLDKDAKTRLQEWLQARHLPLPKYSVSKIGGEAHLQHFTVECRVATLDETVYGEGSSRRVAEQQAAERVLCLLEATATTASRAKKKTCA